MHCGFCYSKTAREQHDDLSLDVWKKFIKQNGKEINCINYGTGENTLVKEWFELIQFVRSNFPSITQALTTNGYLWNAIDDQDCYNSFMTAIDEVDISLDFADHKKHNALRGVDNAYSMALKTAELCQRTEKISTFVMLGIEETLEIENLNSIFQLAKEFNAFVRINIYRPISDQGFDSPKFESIIRSLDWIFENHYVVSLSDSLINSLYNNQESKRAHSHAKSLRILSHGDITPSTYLVTPEWVASNIVEENVLNTLLLTKPFQVFEKAPIPRNCMQCQLVESCKGGTYDRRILFYGTLEERDPYCPFRYYPDYQLPQKQISYEANGPAIHADYLPTLIFKPK